MGPRYYIPSVTSSSLCSDFGLREYTLVSFGCMLMSDTELWSVGADYLASCSVSGLDTLAHFITRVPIAVDSSDHDLRKVLTICERHGLIEEAMEVQRAVARRALDRGDYARAINYFDAASETESVAAVVDRVAEDYLKHGMVQRACARFLFTLTH